MQGGERVRRLLLAWENLLAEIGEPRAHGRIGQGIHDRGIEPGDDGRRRSLGGKKPLPVFDVEPGRPASSTVGMWALPPGGAWP